MEARAWVPELGVNITPVLIHGSHMIATLTAAVQARKLWDLLEKKQADGSFSHTFGALDPVQVGGWEEHHNSEISSVFMVFFSRAITSITLPLGPLGYDGSEIHFESIRLTNHLNSESMFGRFVSCSFRRMIASVDH